ncbi:murein biosynthesis integral membrane protein MurJ [bacterium]|nr:murein biosynthesis integral membrane protein MurJ [bacterium]
MANRETACKGYLMSPTDTPQAKSQSPQHPADLSPGHSTARSSALFTAGTLVSRLSGVLRESVVGAVFGAGTVMDAFVVAYRIPNLLRELIAEGALGSSFTQVYTSTAERDEAAARKVLDDTLRLVFWLGAIVVIGGVILAPSLVTLMNRRGNAPDSAQFTAIAVRQTQILFPTIAIFAITSIVTGALHKKGRFFLSAVSPAAFNFANIAGALFLTPVIVAISSPDVANWLGDAGITGLSLGVLAGAGLQLWIARLGLRGDHRTRSPQWLPWTPETKKIVTLMVPMVIAASAGQVNVIVNTNFATSLEPGAVTWLNFAFRFLQLPIGMFGVAISAAVLPALTRAISRAGNRVDKAASVEIVNALDLVTWLLLPSFVFLYLSSTDVIALFYEAGKFTATDTAATAIALRAYSFGLVSYGLLKVLNSYYYATERTRYAMWVGIVSIAVNYLLNAALVSRMGHRGLALTTSATLTGNTLLLLAGMTRDRVQVDWKELFRSMMILAFASLVALKLHAALKIGLVGLDSFGQPAWKKLTAVVNIFGSAGAVGSAFALFAMIRLRTGPRQFAKMARKFRSKKKAR